MTDTSASHTLVSHLFLTNNMDLGGDLSVSEKSLKHSDLPNRILTHDILVLYFRVTHVALVLVINMSARRVTCLSRNLQLFAGKSLHSDVVSFVVNMMHSFLACTLSLYDTCD